MHLDDISNDTAVTGPINSDCASRSSPDRQGRGIFGSHPPFRMGGSGLFALVLLRLPRSTICLRQGAGAERGPALVVRPFEVVRCGEVRGRQIRHRPPKPGVLRLKVLPPLHLFTLHPAELLASAELRHLAQANRADRLGHSPALRQCRVSHIVARLVHETAIIHTRLSTARVDCVAVGLWNDSYFLSQVLTGRR